MNIALPAVSQIHPLVRRFLSDLLIVSVFNVFCAVVVTYVIRIGDSFAENLVFSMCIGTIALALIDGGRLLIWRESKPPALLFLLLLLVSIPCAHVLGTILAIYILDIPMHNVIAMQSRNAAALIIFIFLGSISTTWFFRTRVKLAELKAKAESENARAAAIEKQAMQAQLQLLQAQIEPHMLFNTLANLQGLIAVDAPRAQHMLDQLIQYLRATLASSRAQTTTLAQEFALMEAYLGLMSVRMAARLSYTLQLPPDLGHVLVPPMLLQPLVENAIKHGLEPKIDGGHITVQASREDGMLELSVIDTGLGLDIPASAAQGPQVGLANVRERLQALCGERASLLLTRNEPGGVIARLSIPL